jgi:hypothetical protein
VRLKVVSRGMLVMHMFNARKINFETCVAFGSEDSQSKSGVRKNKQVTWCSEFVGYEKC